MDDRRAGRQPRAPARRPGAGPAATWSGRARRCSTPGSSGMLARRERRLAAARDREAGRGAASRRRVGAGGQQRAPTRRRDRARSAAARGRGARPRWRTRPGRGDVAGAVDRRGGARRRGGGQRDVALAGQEPRGRVEADPPGAGQEHLGPRVQIDDVAIEAARLIRQHALVGDLHQVARHEARRQAAAAQGRDQQHRRVAAAAAAGVNVSSGVHTPASSRTT
jgi:hypothetical protein